MFSYTKLSESEKRIYDVGFHDGKADKSHDCFVCGYVEAGAGNAKYKKGYHDGYDKGYIDGINDERNKLT